MTNLFSVDTLIFNSSISIALISTFALQCKLLASKNEQAVNIALSLGLFSIINFVILANLVGFYIFREFILAGITGWYVCTLLQVTCYLWMPVLAVIGIKLFQHYKHKKAI